MLTLFKGIIFGSLLVTASIQDIKKREVSNCIHVLIVFTAFINFNIDLLLPMVIGATLTPLPLFIASMLRKDSIGGADIKLMAASGLLLGVSKGLSALIIGLLLAVVITYIIRKIQHKSLNESFPLVPYLAIGIITAYLL